MPFLRPEFVGLRLPACGVCLALLAQVLGALWRFKIRGVSAGPLNQFGQELRIFQHWAGAKMITVKGLTLAVLQKEWLLETLQKALFADICTGVVNEHARLHVTCGVDVTVKFAACDTSVGKLTVILEVDSEDLLATGETTDLAYTVLHIGTLVGSSSPWR